MKRMRSGYCGNFQTLVRRKMFFFSCVLIQTFSLLHLIKIQFVNWNISKFFYLALGQVNKILQVFSISRLVCGSTVKRSYNSTDQLPCSSFCISAQSAFRKSRLPSHSALQVWVFGGFFIFITFLIVTCTFNFVNKTQASSWFFVCLFHNPNIL